MEKGQTVEPVVNSEGLAVGVVDIIATGADSIQGLGCEVGRDGARNWQQNRGGDLGDCLQAEGENVAVLDHCVVRMEAERWWNGQQI